MAAGDDRWRYYYCFQKKPSISPSPITRSGLGSNGNGEGHDRDYFLEKAEEYPFLEEVIKGTSSYVSRLDSILDGIEENAKIFTKDKEGLAELASYLSEVRDVSGQDYVLDTYTRRGEHLEDFKRSKAMFIGSLGGMVGSAALLFLPPFSLIEFILGGTTLTLADRIESRMDMAREVQQNRRAKFVIPYQLAEQIDLEVGKAFVAEHLIEAPQFFERTYAAMSAEEREELEQELQRMLEAGIFPMDEQELTAYLQGLREGLE